jgi:hypothetical protein
MANTNDAGSKVTKWIRWIARIWSIAPIGLALLMFKDVLIDNTYANAGGLPPIEQLLILFANLSAVGLGIAWRWEGLGGAIDVVFQLAGLPLVLIYFPIDKVVAPFMVGMISAAPGALFLVCWWRSRKRAIPHDSA